MSLKQISQHIWQIGISRILPLHVWLVKEADGFTLIDTGIAPMGKSIIKAIDSIAAGSLNKIYITHGHTDHVGSARKILAKKGIPVYCHKDEIPYITGVKPIPGMKKSVKSIDASDLRPLPENDGKLIMMGDILPFYTPGHTPGHVAYFHKGDGVLMAGDLFTEKSGRLKKPMAMFTPNMDLALESGRDVLHQLNPQIVCMGHGRPVNYNLGGKFNDK